MFSLGCFGKQVVATNLTLNCFCWILTISWNCLRISCSFIFKFLGICLDLRICFCYSSFPSAIFPCGPSDERARPGISSSSGHPVKHNFIEVIWMNVEDFFDPWKYPWKSQIIISINNYIIVSDPLLGPRIFWHGTTWMYRHSLDDSPASYLTYLPSPSLNTVNW